MATTAERVTTVSVTDPRLLLKKHRVQPIIKGGQQITYVQVDAQSVDNNNITFQCNPPSGGTIVDRKVLITVPVRLLIKGQVSGANASTCIQATFDALRSFPLSGSVQTLTVTINNQSISVPMGSIIHPLEHYNVDSKLKKSDYSMTPTAYDPCTNYASLTGGVDNPMNFYLDNKEGVPQSRGAFPINVVLNTQAATGQNVSAIVDFVVTEPLFLSPFFFGQKNADGFYNVTTMTISLQMANKYAFRMWSHLNSGAANGVNITDVTAYLTNFTAVEGAGNTAFTYANNTKPSAQFTYITPPDTMKLSPFESLSYPYFNVQSFLTTQAEMASLAQARIITNNLQLSSIPRRMFLFARPNDNTLNSPAGASLPDCYFSIQNVNIQFQNTTGLLSSATPQQLYMLSVKNGCDMDWTQWSGGPTQNAANLGQLDVGSHPGSVYTIGSVLCLEFGTDIPLSSVTDCPGKIGQYNLQIQCTVTNTFPIAIAPTFYTVIVSEGTFTIDKLGVASIHLGDLTTNDVLEAQPRDDVSYYDLQDMTGGSWFDGLKKGFMMPFNAIRKASEYINPIKNVAGLVGMGITTGGSVASYSDLRDRLAAYN